MEQLQQQVVEVRQEIAEHRAALQERDLRYRALLYNLPEKVVHKDRNAVYLSCNKNFASDFGMTPEQMVGKTDYDLYPPEMADKYRADDRRIMASGGTEEIEERYSTPSTQESIVRTLKAAVKDEQGDVTGIMGIFSDITARKQAEGALRQERNCAQQYLDVATVIMVVLDKEGKITLLNRKGYEILQYPEGTLVGQNWWFATCVPERSRNERQTAFRQLMAGQLDPVEYYENAVVTRAGEERIIAWHSALLTDEFGQIVGTLSSGTDVTEQRKSDAALRESQRRLSTLMSNLPGMAYRCRNDRQWTMEFISDGCVLLTGYTPLAFTGNCEIAYGDIIHPADREQVWEEVQRTIAEGRHFQLEYRIITASGEVKWVWEQGVAIYSDSGEVEALEGMMTDITERKRADEVLQEAHEELERRVEERAAELTKANEELAIFQRFAEASGQGFSMADLNGHLIYLNPTLCRMLGEERPENRIGQPLSTYFSEESNRRGRQEIEPALKERGYWEGELPLLSRDGKSVPTWHNTFMIRDENGNPLRMAVVVTDITERKRAEEALAESEAKYRHLVETTDTGYLILDEEGRVVDANVEYVRLTGHQNLGEIMDRRVEEWTASYDVERNAREVRKCMQEGTVRQLEVDYLDPHGKVTPIEINASVMETTQGRRIIALCRDITERKRAEEALRKEHRTLKHLLQSSDHERQLIAYEIHDELAQQLAGAIMQFQTFDHLKDKNPKQATNAYHAGMTMLQQSHFEARRLIAGVRPPILDESGVVEAIAFLVHEQGRCTGQELALHSRVDFDRLAPTLENVIYRIAQEGLTNACQHSKSETVRVSLVQQEDQIRIEIRDWGVGFDTKTVRGNHFGLEGIRQRARLLGGKCSIRSKPDNGTRITVELPVVLRD
jgi:PAS domain S-box-containing protein